MAFAAQKSFATPEALEEAVRDALRAQDGEGMDFVAGDDFRMEISMEGDRVRLKLWPMFAEDDVGGEITDRQRDEEEASRQSALDMVFTALTKAGVEGDGETYVGTQQQFAAALAPFVSDVSQGSAANGALVKQVKARFIAWLEEHHGLDLIFHRSFSDLTTPELVDRAADIVNVHLTGSGDVRTLAIDFDGNRIQEIHQEVALISAANEFMQELGRGIISPSLNVETADYSYYREMRKNFDGDPETIYLESEEEADGIENSGRAAITADSAALYAALGTIADASLQKLRSKLGGQEQGVSV